MPNVATYSVKTLGFKELSKAMAIAVPLSIRTNLRVAFLAAGNMVASKAIEIVDEYSNSVADSIKVRISGMTGVRVVAGGAALPIAGLMELGNEKSKGGSTFRHPVFGNQNVWVSQPMHPYLEPALRSEEDRIGILIEDALDVAIADALVVDTLDEDL